MICTRCFIWIVGDKINWWHSHKFLPFVIRPPSAARRRVSKANFKFWKDIQLLPFSSDGYLLSPTRIRNESTCSEFFCKFWCLLFDSWLIIVWWFLDPREDPFGSHQNPWCAREVAPHVHVNPLCTTGKYFREEKSLLLGKAWVIWQPKGVYFAGFGP